MKTLKHIGTSMVIGFLLFIIIEAFMSITAVPLVAFFDNTLPFWKAYQEQFVSTAAMFGGVVLMMTLSMAFTFWKSYLIAHICVIQSGC